MWSYMEPPFRLESSILPIAAGRDLENLAAASLGCLVLPALDQRIEEREGAQSGLREDARQVEHAVKAEGVGAADVQLVRERRGHLGRRERHAMALLKQIAVRAADRRVLRVRD